MLTAKAQGDASAKQYLCSAEVGDDDYEGYGEDYDEDDAEDHEDQIWRPSLIPVDPI